MTRTVSPNMGPAGYLRSVRLAWDLWSLDKLRIYPDVGDGDGDDAVTSILVAEGQRVIQFLGQVAGKSIHFRHIRGRRTVWVITVLSHPVEVGKTQQWSPPGRVAEWRQNQVVSSGLAGNWVMNRLSHGPGYDQGIDVIRSRPTDGHLIGLLVVSGKDPLDVYCTVTSVLVGQIQGIQAFLGRIIVKKVCSGYLKAAAKGGDDQTVASVLIGVPHGIDPCLGRIAGQWDGQLIGRKQSGGDDHGTVTTFGGLVQGGIDTGQRGVAGWRTGG